MIQQRARQQEFSKHKDIQQVRTITEKAEENENSSNWSDSEKSEQEEKYLDEKVLNTNLESIGRFCASVVPASIDLISKESEKQKSIMHNAEEATSLSDLLAKL